MTERLAHPDDPEFDAIRADLGRLFIKHKHDLAMGHWDDEMISEHAAAICAALIALAQSAKASGDTRWLLRHKWFFGAVERLFDGDDAVKLDS